MTLQGEWRYNGGIDLATILATKLAKTYRKQKFLKMFDGCRPLFCEALRIYRKIEMLNNSRRA